MKQQTIVIESYKAILEYVEVFEIIEQRAKVIIQTKPLGYAHSRDPRFLNPDKYILATLPTKILKAPYVTLTLI